MQKKVNLRTKRKLFDLVAAFESAWIRRFWYHEESEGNLYVTAGALDEFHV
jgi:hypothetical protein